MTCSLLGVHVYTGSQSSWMRVVLDPLSAGCTADSSIKAALRRIRRAARQHVRVWK